MRFSLLVALSGVLACGGSAVGGSGDSGSVGPRDGATDAAEADARSGDASDSGAAAGSIALVNQFSPNGPSGQISLTEGAGDLLVLTTYYAYSCATPSGTMTVSDTAGNTWSLAAREASTPDGGYPDPLEQAQIWYALDVRGGSNTVTMTASDCAPAGAIGGGFLLEYSGVAPAGALDGIASAIAATASNEMDTGPLVTTGNGDLVVGLFVDSCDMTGVLFGAGPGYRPALEAGFGLVEDNTPHLLAPGTSHVTATKGVSDACWIAVAAAFKPR